MPEWGDAMAHRDRLRLLVSPLRVLQGLPGMLLSAQVILLSILLGNSMRMRGLVV
jgi:hypothetical protein